MEKKNFLLAIGLTAIFILASFTNVIGSNLDFRQGKTRVSPLFTVRAMQKLNKPVSNLMNIQYIRKGEKIAFPMKSSLDSLIEKIRRVIRERPKFLYKLLNKIREDKNIMDILKKKNFQINSFDKDIAQIMRNPKMLKQCIMYLSNGNVDSQSLSTSNPIGCIIVIIAMIPVLIVIATITIVTCLVNGCLEQLFENFIQNLEPSD